VLGRVRTNSYGQQYLFTPNGAVLGGYRPESNCTFDLKSHKIGEGNMLAFLLARKAGTVTRPPPRSRAAFELSFVRNSNALISTVRLTIDRFA
jgi:hypothetical protein